LDDPGRHRLTEQILGAEQDERRRIALFLTTARCSRSPASR
jgi:hypothetical protein